MSRSYKEPLSTPVKWSRQVFMGRNLSGSGNFMNHFSYEYPVNKYRICSPDLKKGIKIVDWNNKR